MTVSVPSIIECHWYRSQDKEPQSVSFICRRRVVTNPLSLDQTLLRHVGATNIAGFGRVHAQYFRTAAVASFGEMSSDISDSTIGGSGVNGPFQLPGTSS